METATHYSASRLENDTWLIYLYTYPNVNYIATLTCNEKFVSECTIKYNLTHLKHYFIRKKW